VKSIVVLAPWINVQKVLRVGRGFLLRQEAVIAIPAILAVTTNRADECFRSALVSPIKAISQGNCQFG
jgi:hypothetical protein